MKGCSWHSLENTFWRGSCDPPEHSFSVYVSSRLSAFIYPTPVATPRQPAHLSRGRQWLVPCSCHSRLPRCFLCEPYAVWAESPVWTAALTQVYTGAFTSVLLSSSPVSWPANGFLNGLNENRPNIELKSSLNPNFCSTTWSKKKENASCNSSAFHRDPE